MTPGSCFIYYNGSLFNLLDDSSSTWLIGPNWPQSNFPIPNSTCTVTSGSVSTTAFTRAVTTNVTFAPSATAKTFNVFLFDHDVYAQQTGWQFMGTWTVPGAAPPVSISIAPHSLQQMTSGSTQQFTATVTGTTNTAVSWSISPPSPQATLSSANGNTATVNVTPNQVTPELVTLKATSTANPLIFDTVHLNLQPASPVPSLLTVSSPSLNQIVGATIPQTITFTATDITASQIDWIQPLITSNYPLQDPTMFYNGQPGSNPGCHLLYYSATSLATTQANGVWLYTDDGVAQFAWTPIGSGGGSIWNNRCLVNGQESSATTSSDGQSLQLNLKLTFYAGTSGMSGYQNVFLSAANHQYYSNNLFLGWQFKGYFLVY